MQKHLEQQQEDREQQPAREHTRQHEQFIRNTDAYLVNKLSGNRKIAFNKKEYQRDSKQQD